MVVVTLSHTFDIMCSINYRCDNVSVCQLRDFTQNFSF